MLPLQRIIRPLRQNIHRILAVLLFLLAVDALVLVHQRPRTVRSVLPPQARQVTVNSDPSRPERTNNTSVFIVSIHRNTGKVLPAWGPAVLALVDHLGADNVYFSALETGSQDETKAGLTVLKHQLDARRVPNTITLGMTASQQLDEISARPEPHGPRPEGWIWNEVDLRYDMRRITYLARERNRAMEPLLKLQEQGRTFDKVLWLNDVFFNTEDVLTLLDTRQGDYAAACSQDFKWPPFYYDTFVLRDDQGQKTTSTLWPWFLSPTSQQSAWRSEPVLVQSCWNGMIVFDAAPFYADPPLRFRAIPDTLADLHLEASECCLIHTDNTAAAQQGKGIWLNPNVRVGYSSSAYSAVQGRQGEKFPGPFRTIQGSWKSRWLRWKTSIAQYSGESTVLTRLRKWQAETPDGEPRRQEPGVICLTGEKQIMWKNGWRHL